MNNQLIPIVQDVLLHIPRPYMKNIFTDPIFCYQSGDWATLVRQYTGKPVVAYGSHPLSAPGIKRTTQLPTEKIPVVVSFETPHTRHTLEEMAKIVSPQGVLAVVGFNYKGKAPYDVLRNTKRPKTECHALAGCGFEDCMEVTAKQQFIPLYTQTGEKPIPYYCFIGTAPTQPKRGRISSLIASLTSSFLT